MNGHGGEASSPLVKRGVLRGDACQDTAKAGRALFIRRNFALADQQLQEAED
jgi:hypothetical protein